MKRKVETEFEKFDKLMDGLLAVPYKELQQKLDEEKKVKAAKRLRPKAKRDDARKH